MYSSSCTDKSDIIDQYEIEFYFDMAMNECQRWLEIVCRECFIDSEDFIYSLRYGMHIRKIINNIMPNCFDLSKERFLKEPRTTREILKNAGLQETELEKHIDENDWISQAILICLNCLHISPENLFTLEDLHGTDDLVEPYKTFVLNRENHDKGKRSSKEDYICKSSINDSLRRLCVTISALGEHSQRKNRFVPKLDQTALKPLIDYHEYLVTDKNFERSYRSIVDWSEYCIASTLQAIVEQVCISSSKKDHYESESLSSDEGIQTMVDCNYTVNKYLADLSSEYSMEELSSYSTESKSSRSCSPYVSGDRFANFDQQIPTRSQVKVASHTAHNPLQFISAKAAATALSEQAKQQIIIAEQQKRIREEALSSMLNCECEDEPEWQTNLDSWLSKRKAAKESAKTKTNGSEIARMKNQIIPTTSVQNHVFRDGKCTADSPRPSRSKSDELLTANYTNSVATANLFSVCSNSQAGRNRIGTDLNCEPEATKAAVRFSEVSSGCVEEVEYRPSQCDQLRSLSDTPDSEYSEEFPEPPPSIGRVGGTASKFREVNGFSKTGFAVISNTNRPTCDSLERTNSENFSAISTLSNQRSSDRAQCVTLGVELCRQQSANIVAVKFPTKRQKCTLTYNTQAAPIQPSIESSFTMERKIDIINSMKRAPVSFKNSSERAILHTESKTSFNKSMLNGIHEQTSSDLLMSHGSQTDEGISRSQAVLRTVDIQFEDKPSSAYWPKSTEGSQRSTSTGTVVIKMKVQQYSGNSYTHIGFSLAGGKEENAPFTVATVIAGSPADRNGLLIGDNVQSVNGELVDDQYYQSVVRMLNEAMSYGEIELKIKRSLNLREIVGAAAHSSSHKIVESESITPNSFDQRRMVFAKNCDAKNDFYDFRKNARQNQQAKTSTFNLKTKKLINTPSSPNQLRKDTSMRHDSAGKKSPPQLPTSERDQNSFTRSPECFVRHSSRTSTMSGDSDYRVTYMNEKPKPGRLSDFIPEVERTVHHQTQNRSYDSNMGVGTDGESSSPKIVRNYDITHVGSDSLPSLNHKVFVPDQNRNSFTHSPEFHEYSVPIAKSLPPTPPPASTIPREECEKDDAPIDRTLPRRFRKTSMQRTQSSESTRSYMMETTIEKSQTFSPDSIKTTRSPDDRVRKRVAFKTSLEIPSSRFKSKIEGSISNEKFSTTSHSMKSSSVHRLHPIHISGKGAAKNPNVSARMEFGNRKSSRDQIPIHIAVKTGAEQGKTIPIRSTSVGGRFHESKSRKESENYCSDFLERRKMSYICKKERYTGIDHEERANSSQSSFSTPDGVVHGQSTSNFNTESFNMKEQVWSTPELLEAVDTREWKNIINEQRLPIPGNSNSRNKIDADSKYRVIPNTPSPINDQMRSDCNKSDGHYMSSIGAADISRFENSSKCGVNSPVYSELSAALKPSSNKFEASQRTDEESQLLRSETSSTKYSCPLNLNSSSRLKSNEPLAISGKHKCSHCDVELGRGAAMIIESLNLFYHLSCFRCYVCSAALGNGMQGTDVRVRDGKLHCQRCFSNGNDVGMKFSKV